MMIGIASKEKFEGKGTSVQGWVRFPWVPWIPWLLLPGAGIRQLLWGGMAGWLTQSFSDISGSTEAARLAGK